MVSETEKGFQIRKAPPTEAAVETPETTGDALRQMGKRAILPSEAEGFTGHFDVEGFGLGAAEDGPDLAALAGTEFVDGQG